MIEIYGIKKEHRARVLSSIVMGLGKFGVCTTEPKCPNSGNICDECIPKKHLIFPEGAGRAGQVKISGVESKNRASVDFCVKQALGQFGVCAQIEFIDGGGTA